jgi:hypothetical protein
MILTSILKFETEGKLINYYSVNVPHISQREVDVWCLKTFDLSEDKDRWFTDGWFVYYFKNEEDRNWFLLRWGS